MSEEMEVIDFAKLIAWIVYTRFRGVVRRGIQVDDLLQEGMLSVIKNLPKWKEGGVTQASWLYRNALRDITRYVRKELRHMENQVDWDELEEDELTTDPADEAISHTRLTNLESQVLHMHYELELTYRQIGDALDTSKSTVGRIHDAACEKLWDNLGVTPAV